MALDLKMDQTPLEPIAVIGGGLMGALSSLCVASLGFSVLWFGPEESDRADGADARNYALSPLTVDLLKRLGVWSAIEPHACTVTRMEVFSGDVRIDLSATDAGSDFLSCMVLHRDLLGGLERAVRFRPQIRRIKNKPDSFKATADYVDIKCSEGGFRAKLLIGADGARSWVRRQSGILWGQHDYAQQGVVVVLRTERPHGGVAAQWFEDGEILAFLPLANPNEVSIVLSTSEPFCNDDAYKSRLLEKIQRRSGNRFGAIELIGEPVCAPLRMMLTESQSALRSVLVGDAAHTVHPLAGYGLNLGIQDLLSLEEILKANKTDPGGSTVISAYEKARSWRVKRVQWSLDMLQRLVTQTNPGITRLQRWGMKLVADISPLRQFLIRQAISPQ